MQSSSNDIKKGYPKPNPPVITASENSSGSLSTPRNIGMGEVIVPPLTFSTNYHHNMSLPVYPCGRGYAGQYLLQAYQQPNNFIINFPNNIQRPRTITQEQLHQMGKPALEKTKEGCTINQTNQETEGGQCRRETSEYEGSVSVDASPRAFIPDDTEGCTINTSAPKTGQCGPRVLIANSEASIPGPYSRMQSRPSPVLPQHPNCFIQVPLMYPNPAVNMVRPTLQRLPYSLPRRNSEVPVRNSQVETSSKPATFAVNPLFDVRTIKWETKPNLNQQAKDLKKQITENVEKLFELVTSKTPSQSDQNKELNVDQTNNGNPLAGPIVNKELVQTVMKCCREVESYWTQLSGNDPPKALILGCCKNIQNLISNDIRKTTDGNIVSSLQELTLSLVMVFLIISLK